MVSSSSYYIKSYTALIVLAACICISVEEPIYAKPGEPVEVKIKIPKTDAQILFFIMKNEQGLKRAAVHLFLSSFKVDIIDEFSKDLNATAEPDTRTVKITIFSFEERFAGKIKCHLSPDFEVVKVLEKCGQELRVYEHTI